MNTEALAVREGPATFPDGDPFPSWPMHDAAEETAVLDVLRSGKWGSTHGDVVATFESEFADYQDAGHAICMTNGTIGISVALRAAGVGVGDEVIVPPYTFIATASAALLIGAVPIFADIDPSTHLLDPVAAERAITPRTKAIVVVHLAGRPADLAAFTELGKRHGLVIIEDAAQAHGAAYRGRRVGAIGDMGTFSFQTSKNITSGEGGVILTDDPERASALYSMVNVGRIRGGGWYEHRSVGFNLRLTEFQAALLRAQLVRHPAQQAIRERNATLLDSQLADLVADGRLLLAPADPAVTAHGRHLYIFRVPGLGRAGLRDAAVAALAAEGLRAASTGYVPLHRNEPVINEATEICRRLDRPYLLTPCPQADLVSADTIWLPHNYLLGTPEQTERLGQAISKVVLGLSSDQPG
ncbi:MAG TPA: DegT/DnrJ/EryC1/StrS family aminotransferase [Microlunatus sp.]